MWVGGWKLREVQTGDRIGEYVLREKLGEGGFGVVWKAENPDLPGKIVAIKVARTQEGVALLKSEGEIQHKLRHPGIVRTLSLNMSHDPPYIVREYIPGQSLRDRLDKAPALGLDAILSIAKGVLESLAHAHSKGVTHGDLSPANVIIDQRGNSHLLDFGLSARATSPGNSVEVSATSTSANAEKLRGTLVYLAPEMRAGNSPSQAADVFSAGLIVVEMITRDPIYLRFPIAEIPAWLSDVLEKATARDPSGRFADAAEMLRAICEGQVTASSATVASLETEVGTAQTEARKDGRSSSSGEQSTSRLLPRLAIACALAALLTVVAIATVIIDRRRSSREATPSGAPENRQFGQGEYGAVSVITPGLGVRGCSVGMSASVFRQLFGGESRGAYLIAKDKGVDALIEDERIRTLFFYFVSKDHGPFPGITDKGIGQSSSIEDVINQYGTPSRIGRSTVSKFGTLPGAQEESLDYPALGVNFTFYDGRLADIRIFTKK